jgi:chromosome segregation ATPase
MINKLFGRDDKTNSELERLRAKVTNLELELSNLKTTVDLRDNRYWGLSDRVSKLEREIKEIKEDINYILNVVESLREQQYKNLSNVDRVKVAILEMLKDGDLQPTTIIKRIKGKSNTTIYKALKELENEGKITKYTIFEGKTRKTFYKLAKKG